LGNVRATVGDWLYTFRCEIGVEVGFVIEDEATIFVEGQDNTVSPPFVEGRYTTSNICCRAFTAVALPRDAATVVAHRFLLDVLRCT
jgi:hypothetical protein